ncbi:MAG TPA: MlaD family protein [Solirubrobacteraceae bacterium]|nr:MlaD family protein [Solirubrobacteraceae bacterium]
MGLVVLAVAAIVVVPKLTTSSSDHMIVADFQSATNLVSGANVTAGGVTVGSVGPIQLKGGIASVQLNITTPGIWPLHQGTRAEIRWGGAVSYANRYVELLPGPAGDPLLHDGATLPTQDTITPVEFDQVFNIFNAPTRQALGALSDNGASTFGGRAAAIGSGLAASAPALSSIQGVLQQLGEDPRALETLIAAGATTAAALRAQQPQLTSLVSDAANTFATIGNNAAATQASLAKLAPALDSAQTTLHRLDPTLTRLNTLVGQIRPGAVALRQLASPLNGALVELRTVAPELDSTLADLQGGAPKITTLLDTARPVLTSARTSLHGLAPIAACLLPYGPEIGGFIETWDSFLSNYNAAGHYARALFQAFPATNDQTRTPAQLVAGNPGLGYALIRPPGFGAGSSNFQPACGDTSAGLTASLDPEHP